MRIGTALHCEVRPSEFARKNYFYPDQAKDYQISQYDLPLNLGGWLELPDGSRVGVTRAHMEEDTGKLTHVGASGRINAADHALVDYNRSGVPLVEIVSEPDIRSAAQARAYAAELRGILVATGASDGRMEEGSMRVDANVSVRPVGVHCLRHPLRGEEPQLAALAGSGDRVRGRQADRGPRVRGHGRPGDSPLGRVGGAHRAAALQGGSQRLPLLPRARPRAPRARRRVARSGCRLRSDPCPPTDGPDWPPPSAATRARRKPIRSAPWSTSGWTAWSRPRPRPAHRPRWHSPGRPTKWRRRATSRRRLDTARLRVPAGHGVGRAALGDPVQGRPRRTARAGRRPGGAGDGDGLRGPRLRLARARRSTRSSWPTPTSGPGSSAETRPTAKKLQGFFTGEVMKATKGKANGKDVAAELVRRRDAGQEPSGSSA